MATYVNDLRLKEIATGDESGTWGTSTNTNLSLIADAFSYATKDCFATDADATETMADGSADEIRSLYLKVTSSATLTATRTLTLAPNTVSKVWIIENATTGSQSISISQGSGANVTIPNGDVKVIYTDGGGATAAVVDAFASLNVGDLTATNIAGTLTTAAQPNITSLGTLTGLTTTGDINLGDNDKAVFGAGSDLQIYHDGSDSYIDDAGVGDLVLRGNNQVLIRDKGTNEVMVNCLSGDAVKLYFDNAEKLATTATGIDVTGTITADGLTVDGDGTLQSNASSSVPTLTLKDTDTGISVGQSLGRLSFSSADNSPDTAGERAFIRGYLINGTDYGIDIGAMTSGGSPTKRLTVSGSGDISFYEDTGTTAKLFWDASAESLGIGTTSPQVRLSIDNSATGGEALRIGDTSGASGATIGETYLGFTAYSSGTTQTYPHAWIGVTEHDASDQKGILTFGTRQSNADVAPTEAMRIDSSGNVGINTTSPSYLLSIEAASPTLQLKSSNTTGTNTILFSDSASNFAGNIKYDHSDNSLSFATSSTGSERMRIDSSGNVGIGTTSPTEALSIESDDGLVATSSNVAKTTGVLTGGYLIYSGDGSGAGAGNRAGIQSFATNSVGSTYDLRFYTSDGSTNLVEAMRIDSSGNVRIGATTGFHKVCIAHDDSNTVISDGYTNLELSNPNGTNGTYSRIVFNDDAAAPGAGILGVKLTDTTNNYGQFEFWTRGSSGGSTKMVIEPNGNVGIGTSSPSDELDISSTSPAIRLTDTTTAGLYHTISSSSDDLRISADTGNVGANTEIEFYVDGSEAMRIDSSGNLLVGGTSVGEADSASIDTEGIMTISRASGVGRNMILFQNGGSGVGSITTSTTATAYNTSSDYRLKENVITDWDATTRLKQLRPSRFNFIADADTTVDGFLAHEVQDIVPEAISGVKDAVDDEGNPIYQGIDQSKLVPLLTKAIQEQQTLIEQLQAEVALLKGE